jgi:hypothetical protein
MFSLVQIVKIHGAYFASKQFHGFEDTLIFTSKGKACLPSESSVAMLCNHGNNV